MRAPARRPFVFVAALMAPLLLSCASAPRGLEDYGGPSARGDRQALRLRCEPADAEVYVDGVFQGRAGDLRTLALRAGGHRIEVRRDGYEPYRAELEGSGTTTVLDVELKRKGGGS